MTCNSCGCGLRTWNDVERGLCAECMGTERAQLLTEQTDVTHAVQGGCEGLIGRVGKGDRGAASASGDGCSVATRSVPVPRASAVFILAEIYRRTMKESA